MPTSVQVPSRARPNYSIRLSPAERRVLEAAAADAKEHLGAYIRRVSLLSARRDLVDRAEER